MSVSPSWRDKAHRRIRELCSNAYRQANQLPNGMFRKKHVPYTVPAEASALVKCLDTDDEMRAKSIFVYGWCPWREGGAS